MESLIKEMNDRVKGSEKFWNNPDGANHILTIKAAALSNDNRLPPIVDYIFMSCPRVRLPGQAKA